MSPAVSTRALSSSSSSSLDTVAPIPPPSCVSTTRRVRFCAGTPLEAGESFAAPSKVMVKLTGLFAAIFASPSSGAGFRFLFTAAMGS